MKHDAKLAHQNVQKLRLSREIDVITRWFSLGGRGFLCFRATFCQRNSVFNCLLILFVYLLDGYYLCACLVANVSLSRCAVCCSEFALSCVLFGLFVSCCIHQLADVNFNHFLRLCM